MCMYIFKYNVYYIVTINELLLYMSVFETRGTENCSNFAFIKNFINNRPNWLLIS